MNLTLVSMIKNLCLICRSLCYSFYCFTLLVSNWRMSIILKEIVMIVLEVLSLSQYFDSLLDCFQSEISHLVLKQKPLEVSSELAESI